MFLIARARNVALMVAEAFANLVVVQEKNVRGDSALHHVFLIAQAMYVVMMVVEALVESVLLDKNV